jgi:hypothetical protein
MTMHHDRPDAATVANLRRLGYDVEREETIRAQVKPFAVRDAPPLDRMFRKDVIDRRLYDAGVRIQRLWRLTKAGPNTLRSSVVRGLGGDVEGTAAHLVDAQAEMRALFGRKASEAGCAVQGIWSDYEAQAIIAVVIFEESPSAFASRNKRRRKSGQETVVGALERAADHWRMA